MNKVDKSAIMFVVSMATSIIVVAMLNIWFLMYTLHHVAEMLPHMRIVLTILVIVNAVFGVYVIYEAVMDIKRYIKEA